MLVDTLWNVTKALVSSFTPKRAVLKTGIIFVSSTSTNDILITSSTQSYNASSGCLRLEGGIGIKGNLYVDGTISLNNATGNINFDSTQISTSYTTGAIFLSGGLGISTTVNSSSASAGGALSIAGGVAIGKDTYVGGKLIVKSTDIPISSQTGSFVLHEVASALAKDITSNASSIAKTMVYEGQKQAIDLAKQQLSKLK